MTGRRRRRPTPPPQPLPSERTGAAPSRVWLAKGTPATQAGVLWIKRPMPDGQWPVNQRLPRDDSFSWWVRSHCGHDGGAKQWAFYQEADADMYELIFRANPCRYTRCVERIMIENDGRLRG